MGISEAVLGKDPVTRQNRLVAGAVLLAGAGAYYWYTRRPDHHFGQRLHETTQRAEQRAEQLKREAAERSGQAVEQAGKRVEDTGRSMRGR